MNLPESWKKMSLKRLQMGNIPAFPTTWRCGYPYEFTARFQVDEWLKLGLPYMSEKGWADYLLSMAEGMVTEMTWEQKSAKEALLEAA